MRVEATGICHSDVDHFRGHVHTSWGGAFPSIPGHEIVGRIEKIDAVTAAEWGVAEGDRVAVRELVITPDGYRIYGHDFGIDEGFGTLRGVRRASRASSGILRLPLARGPTRLGTHGVRAAELCHDLGRPGEAKETWWSSKGPGHMGMACIVAARAAGAADIIVTGTNADRFRLERASGNRGGPRGRRRRRRSRREHPETHRRAGSGRRHRRRFWQSGDRQPRHGPGQKGWPRGRCWNEGQAARGLSQRLDPNAADHPPPRRWPRHRSEPWLC